MEQVNGSIAALRVALQKLPLLSSAGWKCAVARMSVQTALFKVVAVVPSSGLHVHIPVRAFVQAQMQGQRMDSTLLSASFVDASKVVTAEERGAAIEEVETRLQRL